MKLGAEGGEPPSRTLAMYSSGSPCCYDFTAIVICASRIQAKRGESKPALNAPLSCRYAAAPVFTDSSVFSGISDFTDFLLICVILKMLICADKDKPGASLTPLAVGFTVWRNGSQQPYYTRRFCNQIRRQTLAPMRWPCLRFAPTLQEH
ncbi:hypothetical protein UY3_15494 [Chelonia mydas]|uniref:Uncharacterized protein n=1 Tax=Chelonia mydas TaxID=8469 RepID=M7AS10_CHEMY|nr:hypothetical protein UY3_15494 [Chelonia mydas]